MSRKSQGSRKSTHARIYDDTKERLQKVVLTRSLKEGKISELAFLDVILQQELPKHEQRLGIPYKRDEVSA